MERTHYTKTLNQAFICKVRTISPEVCLIKKKDHKILQRPQKLKWIKHVCYQAILYLNENYTGMS